MQAWSSAPGVPDPQQGLGSNLPATGFSWGDLVFWCYDLETECIDMLGVIHQEMQYMGVCVCVCVWLGLASVFMV